MNPSIYEPTAGYGMGVDAATGSTLEHFPNPVFVTLQPIGKVAPPPRKPEKADGSAPPTERGVNHS
jgi:hypothetical protein